MKKETKNEIKKNIVTGANIATGSIAGIMAGSVLSSEAATIHEKSTSVYEPMTASTSSATLEPNQEQDSPELVSQFIETSQLKAPISDVEVIRYENVINDDDTQSEVSVIDVCDYEVSVVEVTNLEEKSDEEVCDVDHNCVIDESETQNQQDEGITIDPFQDASESNQYYDQNEMPDYVNDADVDTFMV